MKPLLLLATLLASAPAAGQQASRPNANITSCHGLGNAGNPTEEKCPTASINMPLDMQGYLMTDRGPFRLCDPSASDWSGVAAYVSANEMPAVCHKKP